MDDSAVVAGLVLGRAGLLLKDEHRGRRVPADELARGREAQDARADDGEVIPIALGARPTGRHEIA